MMRPHDCRAFASRHSLAYLTIADIIVYRRHKEATLTPKLGGFELFASPLDQRAASSPSLTASRCGHKILLGDSDSNKTSTSSSTCAEFSGVKYMGCVYCYYGESHNIRCSKHRVDCGSCDAVSTD
jgi:hypothetical protein